MAVKWTARRPALRLYGSWDGDNVAELEDAFPDWSFTVNQDGSLHTVSATGELDADLPVGTWFTHDATYDVDPTTTAQVQEAPGPGPVSFTITAD
jgi:hypothetical protein